MSRRTVFNVECEDLLRRRHKEVQQDEAPYRPPAEHRYLYVGPGDGWKHDGYEWNQNGRWQPVRTHKQQQPTLMRLTFSCKKESEFKRWATKLFHQHEQDMVLIHYFGKTPEPRDGPPTGRKSHRASPAASPRGSPSASPRRRPPPASPPPAIDDSPRPSDGSESPSSTEADSVTPPPAIPLTMNPNLIPPELQHFVSGGDFHHGPLPVDPDLIKGVLSMKPDDEGAASYTIDFAAGDQGGGMIEDFAASPFLPHGFPVFRTYDDDDDDDVLSPRAGHAPDLEFDTDPHDVNLQTLLDALGSDGESSPISSPRSGSPKRQLEIEDLDDDVFSGPPLLVTIRSDAAGDTLPTLQLENSRGSSSSSKRLKEHRREEYNTATTKGEA